MKLIQNTTKIPAGLRGAVLAIGNFDGVHRGHLGVLQEACAIASKIDAPCGVLSFEPHPRQFLRPDAPHFCLTPPALKARLLEVLELDLLVSLPFDEALAQMSAHQFVEQILINDLKAVHVVTGENFYFGKNRQGDTALLKSLGEELGLGVSIIDQITGPSDQRLSSTVVRDFLKMGDVGSAAEILGHYWPIMGKVEKGDQRGRTIGFPTANIKLAPGVEPKFGVYAVRSRLVDGDMGAPMAGVANLGLRPTFAREDAVLEVHLFDFDGDLYGKELFVELIDFLRPERKFNGLEELTAQIAKDTEKAGAILAKIEDQGDPMAVYPIGKAFA